MAEIWYGFIHQPLKTAESMLNRALVIGAGDLLIAFNPAALEAVLVFAKIGGAP